MIIVNRNKKYIYLMLIYIVAGCFTLFADEVHWSEPVNITNLNSSADDFAPAWDRYRNIMYFNSESSSRSLYYNVEIIDSNTFSEPKPALGRINNKSENQSFFSLINENSALISRFRMGNRRSYLNIYETNYRKKSWEEPLLVESLSTDNFVSHPSVSPDATYMVFVTDKSADNGDTDLWIAYRQGNDSWGGLEELSEINTLGNEITPYLASPDTLYFSSDGLGGPGGYDVYMTVRENGIWQNPYPVTEINTEYNESDFTLLPSDLAVFASDRPGGKGGLDIYSIHKIYPAQQAEYVSELEFNIESTIVSGIKTEQKLEYSHYSIIPYIYENNYLNEIHAYSKTSAAKTEIDSIYKYSIVYIAEQLRNNTISDITIDIYLYPGSFTDSGTGINTVEQISNILIDTFDIDENRIAFNRIEIQETVYNETMPLIKFRPDKEFEALKLGGMEIEIFPPGAEFRVFARPAEILTGFDAAIKIDNQLIGTIYTGKQSGDFFFLDNSIYKNEIAVADSMLIIINGQDSLRRNVTSTQLYNISHSIRKVKKYYDFKGSKYEMYALYYQPMDMPAYENDEPLGSINTFIDEEGISEILIIPASEAATLSADKLTGRIKGAGIKVLPCGTALPSVNNSYLSNNMVYMLLR